MINRCSATTLKITALISISPLYSLLECYKFLKTIKTGQ